MKNTTKNLIGLGTLVLMLVSFQTASAYVPGLWDPQPRPVNSNPTFSTPVSTAYTTPVAPTPVTNTTVTTVTNPTPTPAPTPTVARTTTTRRVVVARNPAPVTTVAPTYTATSQVNQYPYPDNGNQLTALSVNGNGGFMPSSIWQWLLVILLILVIIIIARMLGRRPHEVHEMHTVTSH